MTVGTAALLAAVFAIVARALGWVSSGAAVVGGAVSWTVLAGSGLPGFALLGGFVVSGSLLSRLAPESLPPGARRRAVQVAANGWTAAAGAGLVPLAPQLGWALLTGGLASAQADTWASEIGARSARAPRLITTGAPVPRGTSGGITPLGTAGGAAGAAVFAVSAYALGLDPWLALAAGGAGCAGLVADSVLGATVQRAFRCARCGARVDHPRHCDAPAVPLTGWRPLSNDGVNAVATGVGAAIAAAVTALW